MSEKIRIKKRCDHPTAVEKDNGDWSWLYCTVCEQQINEKEEKNYK